MITKEEVKTLLADIENERVERTISTNDTDKFAKAVCAYANDLPNKKLPGYLMVGAFDDGKLSGLKVTDEMLRNLAGLRADGNILPKPALMVERFSFPEGDIAVVEVQPSKHTPVKYKGVAYVRIGARKAEANEEEERILREKSEIKSPTFDSTPCLHSTIDDLDLDLFKKEYLPKFVKASVLKSDKRTVKQQLASLRLFDSVSDCPTVAGILLIGKDPKRVLFGSYIQYVQYAGKNITSKVLNERQFSGNLLTMLKEVDYFIKFTIQKQRPVFVTVLREEMRVNYPYEAMRELAMNLIMHRNYQTNSPARFYEYSDRIEMENPGNLYGKVQPENFPNVTDYRNPIIADAMKVFGYVNSFGRGISMVQEELEENKNGSAIFDFQYISTFKVTVMNADLEDVKAMEDEAEMKQKNEAEIKLERINNQTNKDTDVNNGIDSGAENEAEVKQKNEAEKLSSREAKIIDLIQNDNGVSRLTIANLLSISESSVYREIEKLKKKGLLERIGGDKGGYWKVKQ
jgi:ATP-dependent DNA helicase RecG